MRTLDYVHVDVFTRHVLQGNGLAVVFCDGRFSDALMLDITREFKQFETIFLYAYRDGDVSARIFTMEGELPFAGHPVIGAAAALHDRYAPGEDTLSLRFALAEKTVAVQSTRMQEGYRARMRQGRPAFLGTVDAETAAWLAQAHNLPPDALDATLPVEVVSTGLPYVLIPVAADLSAARITVRDLQVRIAALGASYTYLFNPETLQARTWDNLGLVEDSATGSAAGPLGAYLVRHGLLREGETALIRQGEHAHRPGLLTVQVEQGEVYVTGDVAFFAHGQMMLPPEARYDV